MAMHAFALALLHALAHGGGAGDVHGRVVDAEDKPVAGVDLGSNWSFPDPREEGAAAKPPTMSYGTALVTNGRGEFAGPMDSGFSGVGHAKWTVLALDADRKRGALVTIDPSRPDAALEVALQPLVEVRGSFEVHAAGEPPKTLGFWIVPASGLGSLAQCITTSGEFRLLLPPGEYQPHYSTDAVNLFMRQPLEGRLEIAAGQSSIDLGAIVVEVPLTATLEGLVVDAEDRPVPGARVGTSWTIDGDMRYPWRGATTDETGRFSFSDEVYDAKQPSSLLVFDAERKRCGLMIWTAETWKDPRTIRLEPAIRVHGTYVVVGTTTPPSWTNTTVSTTAEDLGVAENLRDLRIVQVRSTEGRFELELPAGRYKLESYGVDTKSVSRDLELSADRPDVDLGTIALPQTVLARLAGKEAPAWTLTDARGLDRSAKLSDFKGKWVLIEFWGYW